MEKVVLVDAKDNQVGLEEKMKAHQNGGKLHRAFSIFVFNSKGEMLLQQRARTKYHFGSLWTNTVCSHPRDGEKPIDAAHRRLMEEFGFDTGLKEAFSFTYKATDRNTSLTEWEYDHVFIGTFDGQPRPNPEEIDNFKWVPKADLLNDVKNNPNAYTPWFKIALKQVFEKA